MLYFCVVFLWYICNSLKRDFEEKTMQVEIVENKHIKIKRNFFFMESVLYVLYCCAVFFCCTFVLYFRLIFFVLYFCVVFLCCIFVLYFCVIFSVLYFRGVFSCYIFVLYFCVISVCCIFVLYIFSCIFV